jgi:hypothetical protein
MNIDPINSVANFHVLCNSMPESAQLECGRYVRPEVKGLITRIRVPTEAAAEVVPTFWLCPHPRALSRVK